MLRLAVVSSVLILIGSVPPLVVPAIVRLPGPLSIVGIPVRIGPFVSVVLASSPTLASVVILSIVGIHAFPSVRLGFRRRRWRCCALLAWVVHKVLENVLNIIENLPPELESIREQLDSLVRRHRLLPALFVVLEKAQPNVPGVLLVQ